MLESGDSHNFTMMTHFISINGGYLRQMVLVERLVLTSNPRSVFSARDDDDSLLL